jgi:hypothetical protein
MHVEDVKHVTARFDIGAKASARLAPSDTEIIVESPYHRQARKQNVSVKAAVEFSGLAQKEIHFEFLGYESRLIVAERSVAEAEDFLKRDYIGVEFSQHFDYAGGIGSSVETFASVNVISGYSNMFHQTGLLPFKFTAYAHEIFYNSIPSSGYC